MQNPNQQSIGAKKAESRRPFHGNKILEDTEIRSRFKQRAQAILSDLKILDRYGFSYSPFLEIGAGSVQRSAALINNYSADGVASDISENSLRDAPFVLSMLGYDLMPVLVSCDAHHIPFLPNTFNFVFSYQTIHHFEDPIPVLSECYRVLAKGGYLFFCEEPMDSRYRRILRGDRLLSHPPSRIQEQAYRLGIEKLFWDDGAHERSIGITEARFDIDLWRQALEPFEIIDIEVNRKLKIHSRLNKFSLSTALSGAIGGNVRGLCAKTEGDEVSDDLRDRFMCIDCKEPLITRSGDNQLFC